MTPLATSDNAIRFDDGLPGFEHSRSFVLIRSEVLEPFTLVQGTEDGAPSFLAIDPWQVAPNYTSPLTDADLVRLDAGPETPLLWLSIVATDASGAATINLRAPLVINPGAMRGIQVLSPDSPYRTDHPFSTV